MNGKITQEEFNTKYNKYARELFVISYGYTKNKQESEDILQEVFLAYLNSGKSFKSSNDEKYWLIRVTINKSINYTKSYYRKNVVVNTDALILNSQTNSSSLEVDLMLECIANLPKKHKEILILYYFDDLSIIDLSKILRISQSAVKSRLLRARNLLKKKMEDDNDG